MEYDATVSTTIVKSWRFEYDGIHLLRVDERYDSNNSGSITEADSWRRLHENSHRPGSLSHLLAKKVYNYASNTTGTPSGSTDYFYAYDPVGNVTAISNGAGTRPYAFTQDAWGNELSVGAFTGDNWTTARNAGVWEHQTGKWLDGFTGLYYFHARFYDSKVGRFVGRDPVREVGGKIYALAYNRPTKNSDPSGRYGGCGGCINYPPGGPEPNPLGPDRRGCKSPKSLQDITGGPCSCLPSDIKSWSEGILDWVDIWGGIFDDPGSTDKSNAFRHCLWQCLLTQHCGKNIAALAGWWHENPNPKDPDYIADIINNQEGRRNGMEAPCPANCYQMCREDLDNGILVGR